MYPDEGMEGTARTTANDDGSRPMIQVFFEVHQSGARVGEMVIYDTAGEALETLRTTNPGAAASEFNASYPFISALDVVVFAIPPTLLDSEKEDSEVRSIQPPPGSPPKPEIDAATNTSRIIAQVARAWYDVEGRTPGAVPPLVIFALTKCEMFEGDELGGHRVFDDYLLKPRFTASEPTGLGESLLASLAQDAGLVKAFMDSKGAGGIVQEAGLLIGERGQEYYCALSGTGSPGGSRRLPTGRDGLPIGSPDRSLDPLIIALVANRVLSAQPAVPPDGDL
jgi:hypothetical protein